MKVPVLLFILFSHQLFALNYEDTTTKANSDAAYSQPSNLDSTNEVLTKPRNQSKVSCFAGVSLGLHNTLAYLI